MFCLRRRADLDLAGFTRYWRDVHGPLIASHAAALRILAYRQLQPMPPEVNDRAGRSRGAPEPGVEATFRAARPVIRG